MEKKTTKWIIVGVIVAFIAVAIFLYWWDKKIRVVNGNGNGNGDPQFEPIYHAECYDNTSTNFAQLLWPGPPGPEIVLHYYDHVSEFVLMEYLVFGPSLLVAMTAWYYDGRITIIQWQGIAYQYYDLGGT